MDKQKKKKVIIWSSAGATLATALILVFIFAILPLLKKDGTDKSRLFDIESVAILLDEEDVTNGEINRERGASFTLTVVIDDGATVDATRHDAPKVEWSFVGGNLGCSLNNGVVTVGNTLGTTKIKVKVTSKNEISKEVDLTVTNLLVEINKVEIFLDTTDVTNQTTTVEYKTKTSLQYSVVVNDGAAVDTSTYELPVIQWSFVGSNLNNTVANGLVNLTNTALGDAVVQVRVSGKNAVTKTTNIKVTVKEGSTLESISITTPPNKTTYEVGSTFDRTGMVVVANFGHADDGYQVVIENYTIIPSGALAEGTDAVTISYTHDSVTKTTQRGISLTKTLTSITAVLPAGQLTYTEGQQLNLTGIRIMGNYEFIPAEELDFSDCYVDFNLDEDLTLDDTSILIKHLPSGLTTTLTLTINERAVTAISVFGYYGKTNYIRHQVFDTSTLQVWAIYDYGASRLVTDYTLSNPGKLALGETEMIVSYRGFSHTIDITVRTPYHEDQLRTIKIEGDPEDVSLTWIFAYPDEYGIDEVIDFQTYEERDLLYDEENGEYLVPIHATVTIRKINPSITNFILDGVVQVLDHREDSFDFKVGVGFGEITIEYEKVTGDRITLRFIDEDTGNILVFYFSATWNGTLSSDYLYRMAFNFFETTDYYYEYKIGTQKFRFADFADAEFIDEFIDRATLDTILIPIVFTVSKQERPAAETEELTLILWGTVQTSATVVKGIDYISQLLEPTRSGYSFVQWQQDGSDASGLTYRAIWETLYPMGGDYDAEEIKGTWSATLGAPHDTTVVFSFDKDGNYTYKQGAYELYGVYRIEDGEIVIKTVDVLDFDYLLTDLLDFSFELFEDLEDGGITKLKATVFVVTIEYDVPDELDPEILVNRPSVAKLVDIILSWVG